MGEKKNGVRSYGQNTGSKIRSERVFNKKMIASDPSVIEKVQCMFKSISKIDRIFLDFDRDRIQKRNNGMRVVDKNAGQEKRRKEKSFSKKRFGVRETTFLRGADCMMVI